MLIYFHSRSPMAIFLFTFTSYVYRVYLRERKRDLFYGQTHLVIVTNKQHFGSILILFSKILNDSDVLCLFILYGSTLSSYLLSKFIVSTSFPPKKGPFFKYTIAMMENYNFEGDFQTQHTHTHILGLI